MQPAEQQSAQSTNANNDKLEDAQLPVEQAMVRTNKIELGWTDLFAMSSPPVGVHQQHDPTVAAERDSIVVAATYANKDNQGALVRQS